MMGLSDAKRFSFMMRAVLKQCAQNTHHTACLAYHRRDVDCDFVTIRGIKNRQYG